MATSESEIRNAVSLLLRQHGSLTTTEVKNLLHTVVNFDGEDMQMSETRLAEPLIMQRIGNVVSHQIENIAIYNNYSIDKTVKPAVWSIIN